jgi:hypothetical protein
MSNFVCIEVDEDGNKEFVNLDAIERVVYYVRIICTQDSDGNELDEEFVRPWLKVYFASGEMHEYMRDRAANLIVHIDPSLEEGFRRAHYWRPRGQGDGRTWSRMER